MVTCGADHANEHIDFSKDELVALLNFIHLWAPPVIVDLGLAVLVGVDPTDGELLHTSASFSIPRRASPMIWTPFITCPTVGANCRGLATASTSSGKLSCGADRKSVV